MQDPKYIQNVAIVGANGHLGSHFTTELLKGGTLSITAITRHDSTSKFPAEVQVARVDYSDEQSLLRALQGQNFLIITLGVRASPDLHSKLVQAAARAGVHYVMPNAYGFDILNTKLQEEYLYGTAAMTAISDVQKAGLNYVAMCCGAWYEWSLVLGGFGFDVKNRKVTFFDDGATKISASTWLQCGKALAMLLKLPLTKTTGLALEYWKSKPFFVSSFLVSQRDILESLHRVLGTKDSEWQISYEPAMQRYTDGLEQLQKGDRAGFSKAMYARIFYANGDGDFESSKNQANDGLGLVQEDLDEATRKALTMVEGGWSPLKT